MGSSLMLAALLVALPFDPRIDADREPPSSWSASAGVDLQGEAFGAWGEIRGPRFLDDQLAASLAGGVLWSPIILPGTRDADPVGPLSPIGTLRLRLELSLRIAESPHRMFVALGPSAIFPASELSTTRVGMGAHGGVGVELFAGDRWSTDPIALVIEVGAVGHFARADARSDDAEQASPLATGLVVSAGLRVYPFETNRSEDR